MSAPYCRCFSTQWEHGLLITFPSEAEGWGREGANQIQYWLVEELAHLAGLNTRFVLLLFPMPPVGLSCWVTMSLPSSNLAIVSFDLFLQQLNWKVPGISFRETELRRRESTCYSKKESLGNPSSSLWSWEMSTCGCLVFYRGMPLNSGPILGLQSEQFICNNKEEISGKM